MREGRASPKDHSQRPAPPEPLLNQLHEPGEARMVAVGPHLIEGGGGAGRRLQCLIPCSLSLIADNEKEAGKINGDKCP